MQHPIYVELTSIFTCMLKVFFLLLPVDLIVLAPVIPLASVDAAVTTLDVEIDGSFILSKVSDLAKVRLAVFLDCLCFKI